MSSELDADFQTSEKWRDEAIALREILLSCDVIEEQKWNKPCYSRDGENIAIIQRFTDKLALMFFKGILLDDPKGLLKPQGPNSRSALRLEFTSVEDVNSNDEAIRTLINDAIRVELAGLKVEKSDDLELPEELAFAFDDDPDFREAFETLTPGRQRGYCLHFSEPKKTETRTARIEKHRDRIMSGKGIHDR